MRRSALLEARPPRPAATTGAVVREDQRHGAVAAWRRGRLGVLGEPSVRKRLIGAGGVLLLLAILVPAFRINMLNAADPTFFTQWQVDSEALVLGKIESTTPSAPPSDAAQFGLLQAEPDIMTPYQTFDGLSAGQKPATTSYITYASSLGLQGFLFLGLYDLGLHHEQLLWTVSSILTALSVAVFGIMLARRTRWSYTVAFWAVAVASPWFVAAARDLYWVPWTWFLPASVALWWIRTSGRTRVIATGVLGATFALRWACGYEFISCITLLAMAMPLLSAAFDPGAAGLWRRAIRHALAIAAIAVGSFVVIVTVHIFVVGYGNPVQGLQAVFYDAAKRAYGGVDLTDPLLIASVHANPIRVVATYFFTWKTDVLAFNLGTPIAFRLIGAAFWPVVVAACAVPLVRAWRRDTRWRRDAVILVVALAIPVNWYILAKGHSYVHPHIDFVLWYLLGVSGLVWVLVAGAADVVRGGAIAALASSRRIVGGGS